MGRIIHNALRIEAGGCNVRVKFGSVQHWWIRRGRVAPIRAVAGPQRQYRWLPGTIMGGPQSVEYSQRRFLLPAAMSPRGSAINTREYSLKETRPFRVRPRDQVGGDRRSMSEPGHKSSRCFENLGSCGSGR
ncbi:hypothetical protein JOF46_000522 [Paeniglutamicibacter psychrophenolicus]|uniref:Uncharacterized protein n=1 Tax=Paeniglutamicibacter psychrophenolicus TaxID=257454 RepID=A0ABS4W8V6_9MICC|nr:hypothetical protein [Paeniglutamicibacter psychrophenolicus]